MRIAVISAVLLAFAPLSCVGQNSAVYTYPQGSREQSHSCPLTMHVRQRGVGSLIATDAQGKRTEQLAARLKLEITDRRLDETGPDETHPARTGHRMVSASVIVHGWKPKARALPLGWDLAPDGSPVRRMTVPLTGGGLLEATADLLLPGMTAARLVQLESITYDDGQVWTLASCQAEPDPFMPVEYSK